MKKIISKIISLTLSTIIAVGVMPAAVARANSQIPVTTLQITDTSGASGYTINLNWDKPSVATDGSTQYPNAEVEEFHIYYRNASKSQAYPSNPNVNPIKDVTPESYSNSLSPVLDQGSLYMFKVDAVHWHQVPYQNGYQTVKASTATGYTVSEVLYLTDIQVEAEGSGDTMTVTWDYPRLDGKDIFTGYRISYVPGGSLNDTIGSDSATKVVDVDINSASLQKISGNKLQFSFQDSDLKPGIKYALKVEPLVGANPNYTLVRTLKNIEYNGVRYPIAYTDRTKREYRTNDASVKLSLKVTDEDDTRIRLTWDSFNTISDIDKVEIYSSSGDDFTLTKLEGTYLGDYAKNLNYLLLDKPGTLTYYKIMRYVKGSDIPIESEIARYDPAYTDFEPYTPNITKMTASDTIPITMDVTWEAFVRAPYTKEEQQIAVNNRYLDRNVYYDIWVTDNANNLDYMNEEQIIVTLDAANLTPSTTDPPTFITTIQQYYAAVVDPSSGAVTGYELKSLDENKVYYFKIVARRPTEQQSRPAYGSCFIPPIKDVPTDPIAISRPPLRIKKDSEGNEEITNNSITIQWDTRWVEAYNDADKSWYSSIGLDSSGKIVYGDALKDAAKIVELNNSAYQMGDATSGYTYNSSVIAGALGVSEGSLPPLRLMNLKDAKYEIYVAEYDLMSTSPYTGYESYLAMLQKEENAGLWVPVTPEGNSEHPEFTVTSAQNPAGALKTNTAYIIFFRPYVEVDQKRVSYVPNFVVGTTKDAKGDVNIKPTVPVPEAVSETDTTLTVRWIYNPDLTYELKYSENLADYPDRGTSIGWAALEAGAEIKAEGDKQYIYYTIDGLFPETIYHIWVRAMSETETSNWSNPISMTTKDIEAPAPPRGLSHAAKEHVDLYNKANSVAYTPTASDYLIIEWMRDALDTLSSTSGIGGETGSAELLSHPDITNMYMVRFKELIANRTYYIRAKTVLTITKTGNGVERQYNYIVQVSPNEDFTDAIEVSVPALSELSSLDPVYTKRKESDWSTTIHLYTSRTDSEYDGDKNPEHYPLPSQDYEIIYDGATDTLTFRFRTDQKDATGANDNSVDQRFISKLISSKTFTYTVDLSRYNNKTVTNRVIELPYSIFKAFEERKIQLALKAENATITIMPGSLQTADLKGLTDFGKGANVKISISGNAKGTPAPGEGATYASTPHKLAIQVKTSSRTLNLTNLAKQIKVDLKLDNRYTTLDQSVSAYVADADTGGWQRVNGSYNSLSGLITFNTYKAANYSAIASAAATVETGGNTQIKPSTYDALMNVTSKLNITDLGSFSPQAPVHANLFNNLVAGVVRNESNFTINTSMTDEDYNALGKSNLLVSGAEVSREAGINTLVRLYELKTKKTIKNYSSLTETQYKDIANADAKYQAALLKAGDLGFYDDSLTADPKGKLTMGDLLYMIDIILQDAGM